MSDQRIPLTIPIKHWFQDHCFAGKSVLPAVETMLLLAANVVDVFPEVDIRVMENVCFAKFLEIPPDTATITGLVEWRADRYGGVRIKLLSRMQNKAMNRILEHGEILFSSAKTLNSYALPAPDFNPAPPQGSVTEIEVGQLYRELVPFGASYHTLQQTLFMSDNIAWGRLKAPELPVDPIQKIIGSPFPLDGALHAACVLGQQTAGFVPFPVGFARRLIHRPTQPGVYYNTRIIQLPGTDDELVFDLVIFDNEEQMYETVTGLRMRDVGCVLKK